MSKIFTNGLKAKDISELEQALAESQADLASGRFDVESVEQHLARIKPDLAQD